MNPRACSLKSVGRGRHGTWPRLLRLSLTFGLGLLSARAELPAEGLAAVLKTHRDSVLFLGGALKYRCGRCSNDHDLRVLSTAVVIDPNGLLMAARMGPLLDPKSEIRESSLRVTAADGAELPVRVAVTDNELGVLVLAVEKPADVEAHPLKALDLATKTTATVLDELIVLRRLDKRTGYPVHAFAVRVSAVDDRPRRTYLSGNFPDQELTIAPCFTASGQFVALYTGAEAAVAADEFVDLLNQARQQQAKGVKSP